MNSDIAIQPSVLSYISLEPLLTDFSESAILDFKSKIILEAQGDAVEIKGNINPSLCPIVISALYNCTKELVLKLSDERKVIIFSHISPEFCIRPEGMIFEVQEKIIEIKEEAEIAKKENYTIDILEIWNGIKSDTDIVKKTILFLNQLKKKIAYSDVIEIEGEIPALPLLSAAYLMRGFGKEIYYANSMVSKIRLF